MFRTAIVEQKFRFYTGQKVIYTPVKRTGLKKLSKLRQTSPEHCQLFDKGFLIRYSCNQVDEDMQREDVVRILKEQQKILAERYSVERMSLFGSVARGEARDDSDVDLFSEPLPEYSLGKNAGHPKYFST